MKKGTLLAVTAIVVGSAIGYRYKKELLKKFRLQINYFQHLK